MTRTRIAAAAAACAAALAAAAPVAATTCDESAIAARSLDGTAEMIWSHSDLIGFATVTTIDTPERDQQIIDLIAPLKGAAGSYPYAPLRIGRTGWKGPGLYRLPVRPGEIVFLTLVRTEAGYVVPACREPALARNQAGLIRRLGAIARARRTGRA